MSLLDKIPSDPVIDSFVENSFNISDRIEEILLHKGLTQKQFSKMLGKNESEISKWMSGMHNFTIKTISHIEIVLGESILTITRSNDQETFDYNFVEDRFLTEPVDCQSCLKGVESIIINNISPQEFSLV